MEDICRALVLCLVLIAGTVIEKAPSVGHPDGGISMLVRDNIIFTTADIPSVINAHNTELQMVKVL